MRTSAIIVGGGIGGLATAVALSRDGWNVEVFEKAEAFEPVGAGLGLGPNAVAALDWLGLADDVRQVGRAPGEAGIRTSAGRWLLRLDPAEVEARFGNPWLGVHRSDLHRVLLAAASAAEFRTDHEAVAITTSARDATVTFQTPSGVSARTADLVVAADGVHSRMRSALFPGSPDASYAGYFCWRGVVPAERAREISTDDALVETWGRGKRLGTVPLGDGRIYWFACPSAPSGTHETSSLEEVEGCFAGWHSPIPQLLAATPPAALIRNDAYYVAARLPTYVRGRAVLLGDAAHAVTPDLAQGAGLAIEDAVVLADALRRHENVSTALQAYDHVRRPRTQKLARLSGRLGRTLQGRSAPGAAARNVIARVVPSRLVLRAVGDMLAWQPPRGAGASDVALAAEPGTSTGSRR